MSGRDATLMNAIPKLLFRILSGDISQVPLHKETKKLLFTFHKNATGQSRTKET